MHCDATTRLDPDGMIQDLRDEEMDVDGEEGEQDASDILYADFFKPPPYAKRMANERFKSAGGKDVDRAPKGRSQPAKEQKKDDAERADANAAPEFVAKMKRVPSVRFAQQVAVRRIKSRKEKRNMSEEMIRMLIDGGLDKQEATEAMKQVQDASEDDDEDESEEEDEEGDEQEGDGDDDDAPEEPEDEDEDEDEEGSNAGETEDDEDMSVDDDAADDDAQMQTVRRVTGDLFADEPQEEACKYARRSWLLRRPR